MVDYDIGVEIPAERVCMRKPGSVYSILEGLPENGSYFFQGRKQETVASTASNLFKAGRIDFRIRTRAVTENGIKGVRAWRLPNDSE